jgi:N-acetylglucosamine-6-sulfatase
MSEGKYGTVLYSNHTYKALRVIRENYNLLDTLWWCGEHELYELKVYYTTKSATYLTDNYMQTGPFEIHNLYNPSSSATASFQLPLLSPTTPLRRIPLSNLLNRIDALFMVLKTCMGSACRWAWSVRHPSSNVQYPRDALESRYDCFYASQDRMEFMRCEKRSS